MALRAALVTFAFFMIWVFIFFLFFCLINSISVYY
jgi:hypothetical protein